MAKNLAIDKDTGQLTDTSKTEAAAVFRTAASGALVLTGTPQFEDDSQQAELMLLAEKLRGYAKRIENGEADEDLTATPPDPGAGDEADDEDLTGAK